MILERLFQNACWLEFLEMLTSRPGTEASGFITFILWISTIPNPELPNRVFFCDLIITYVLLDCGSFYKSSVGQIRKLRPDSEFHFTDSGTIEYRCLKASGPFLF